MVRHNETFEARQVRIRAIPRDQERRRGDVTQLQAVHRRQRAQLRVLDGQQVPVTDGGGLVTLGPDL